MEPRTSTDRPPYARFDDLRPHRRRSFELSDADHLLIAGSAGEVADVLDAAEAAVERGSWVAGFVSYEAAPGLDPTLQVVSSPAGEFDGFPAAWFAVFPHRSPTSAAPAAGYTLGDWIASVDESGHGHAVDEIRELIKRGETYQVNYTIGMSAPFSGSARSLYLDLTASQACGYGAFIDAGRWQIASASPELFFEWADGRIMCRPMKGTAPRGLVTADDEEHRLALLASEKDRAENVMIVDMVRNDLGRVAAVGSVDTPALFTAEKYDTLWQLTSTVTATTEPGTSLLTVFRALFPSASITGAPKVATMGIIRALEHRPRGVYCGTIGFGGPGVDGRPEWAFNVAIRTVLVDVEHGVAHYGTGGGITIDSTAGGEYREALLKAEILARRTADFRLLETMVWRPGSGVWLLDRHLNRLMESAWYFDVPIDASIVEASIKAATDRLTAASIVRLLVDRTGGMVVEAGPLPLADVVVRLVLDDRPVDRLDPLLYHKTTSRSVYEAALNRHPEAPDVVLWNEADEITETTVGNLAVLLDGEWWTPPVTSGCLPGTYRAELLDEARIRERVISVDELRVANAIARLNSVRGWETAFLM
ncbi:MAG: chorismate-binding protein [Acidimicrobiia bacterium]|nr:chorismate-binding protein [Acidimicrobiia bacterium]